MTDAPIAILFVNMQGHIVGTRLRSQKPKENDSVQSHLKVDFNSNARATLLNVSTTVQLKIIVRRTSNGLPMGPRYRDVLQHQIISQFQIMKFINYNS